MRRQGFSICRFCVLAAIIGLLSGCAFKTSHYGASINNVERIKAASIKPVSVSPFQSSMPGLDTIFCRGVGPVTVTPNFQSYIEKAFIDELKLAGAYNPNSEVTLFGKLEEIDFSSGMTDGNWRFILTISNGQNQSYTTKSVYQFSGSYIGDKACQEVAQAFTPAVQKLIGDVVQNPNFRKLLR